MAKSPTLDEISASLEAIANATEDYIKRLEDKGDMTALLVAFYHLSDSYKRVDEARKKVYAVKDWMDKKLLPAHFEKRDTDKIQIATIAKSFYPLTKYSASIKDKERGYDWLRENGLGSIITETVNAGTLSSALKDWVAETGKDPDPDLITFTTYYSIGMSSYTPKD